MAKLNWSERLLAVYSGVITLAFAALILTGARSKSMSFDELTVQRLNVVEPDGKPRVIISNRPRFPGIYMNGKEYRHPYREADKTPRGGFVFYNDDGDEVGGYIFANMEKEGHKIASTILTFDQY